MQDSFTPHYLMLSFFPSSSIFFAWCRALRVKKNVASSHLFRAHPPLKRSFESKNLDAVWKSLPLTDIPRTFFLFFFFSFFFIQATAWNPRRREWQRKIKWCWRRKRKIKQKKTCGCREGGDRARVRNGGRKASLWCSSVDPACCLGRRQVW